MNAALKRNPVFWLMWMIPGAAVIAGLGMVATAMQGADRALPSIYHWEGELLDADFERARTAAKLGLVAGLDIVDGQCRLTLRGADAPAVKLVLTNGSDIRLDRLLTLARGTDGSYHAACAPLAAGRWRVALQDEANTWSLRTQIDEARARVEMVARPPEGSGA